MQFLKSLFCLHGLDNRTRFFTISIGVYVLFVMLVSAFSNSIIIPLILLVMFSLILGLTSLRRLHDAKLNKKWLLAPCLTFLLVGIIIIISQQSSSYYLLILPTLCSAVLLTYQSTNKHSYILGYYGPVDMNEYRQNSHKSAQSQYRIEPTLVSDTSSNNYYSQTHNDSSQEYNQTDKIEDDNYSHHRQANKQTDIGELIRLNLLNNRKAQLIIVAIIGITLIGVSTSWLIHYLDSADETLINQNNNKEQVSVLPSILRSHPLPMPDNYTLYLSEHSGISINWQADEVENSLLWSQLTAQGDESCKEISFNKGKPIRTLSVKVEESNGINSNYFASFSPLDSQELIQALAFRGNFTLCGYNFSLKGSQAALGTNNQYSHWVEY
ncbi:hypothetical protein Q4506_07965 [Colwellia sp. 4_MG-2023]|uniref:hypothetical protein n=1 Tax=unclassified Colwellia TaxID=196834 RepID=UPI001C0A42CB|nr:MULTISPECIES: hypothetical protein [unclassified Colwellia]MBU2923921.1 hypothetical protein [Colwellia sp. C2M11]MDO6507619.1 hypothetical protein [Colwellia sp. 5_MG-2023]MDO6555615.1 hypothetical protein [Colwellia sp. 4_MG-2023]MDO6653008.1 hypothetical protein [Colwellia sp. 3_MG-2023]MDO6666005.1 hypothetical protein [Colwellia sp. 2_MG-2023]